MIVDDMRTVRMLLPAYFVGRDYVFFEAESGEVALQNIPSFQPDLLITDVHMPGMSGFELCRAAREIPSFSDLPAMLITGDPDLDGLAARHGLNELAALIAKPLDPEEVRGLVSEMLGEFAD
ncbi:MAG: response regulator [Deltaproteobacteria bacterium]|nr:response regulator [Deltaproteobacteria bacterium]